MSRLDSLIGFFSPETEARRIRARMLVDQLRPIAAKGRRAYEGGSKRGRTAGWTTAPTSANAALSYSLQTLRDRSRDLVRNNPWAERAVRIIESNTVGAGIIPQARSKSKTRDRAVQDLWREWGETPACDADGIHDFYGLQGLAMRTIAKSGGVLVRRIWKGKDSGLPVPLQLRVMEPDYIDTARDGATQDGGRIIQGIELDKNEKIVAFWLFPQHPGDRIAFMKGYQSERVPASEILYSFRVDRPGQVHGVPWGAPALIRMKDLDDLEDANLMRAKVAACFAAFVKDTDGADDATSSNDATVQAYSKIEPGAIELLAPGRDITFANPPPMQALDGSMRTYLRSIAAAFGITYEQLTGDFSQVNFSSARLGWIELGRNVDCWRWKMLIPSFCAPAWGWFIEAAELVGLAKGPHPATWTAPRREMIDPAKETEGTVAQVTAGLMSLSEAIREQGRDPDETLGELGDDYKKVDKLGLKLTTDLRAKAMPAAPAPAAKKAEEPAKASTEDAAADGAEDAAAG
jgi:lambda family phage portal protein